MNAARDRARTFLAYGFAISLAVHALVLPFIHGTTAQAYEEPPDIFKRDPMPTPPPTPPPTPTPVPAVARTQPPREKPHARVSPQPLRVVPPHAEAHRGGGSEPSAPGPREPSGVVDGPAPAAPGANDGVVKPVVADPTPQPTPTPLSCARPDVPATTIRAPAPEMPPLALQQGIAGTVVVIVSLDAQSRIVATRIGSSPSAVLNAAALAAARGSQFKTEVKNCVPRGADYTFSVEFTAE